MKSTIITGSLRRSGGGGGTSTWYPQAPSSYPYTTGTVNVFGPIDHGNSVYTLFHPTGQHVIRVNSNGHLWAAISYNDSIVHNPQNWRVWRSTNGGTSWSTMLDSANLSDPQTGICPILEIDENENIYVFSNNYPSGATKMYKFLSSTGWTVPAAGTQLTTLTSGKYNVFLDQSRQWIWVLFWSFGDSTSTNLMAFNYNGVQQYARRVFKPYIRDWTPTLNASTDLHAATSHYPCVRVGVDGTVYVAWNSQAFQGGAFTGSSLSYYDVRMVYSTSSKAAFQAGTETWWGPTNGVNGAISARTVPFCTDDSSASIAERAFPICKLSDTTEFIPATASNYGVNSGQQYNYNRMMDMVPNHGALHFFYESESNGSPGGATVSQHHPYARFNLSTNALADGERRSPEFHCDTTTAGDRLGQNMGQGGGNYVQDTTQANRLYFVSRTHLDVDGKILVFRSDDGGISWWQYAQSAAVGTPTANGLLNIGAYRWTCTDGVLAGICAYGDSPYNMFVFTVTPN